MIKTGDGDHLVCVIGTIGSFEWIVLYVGPIVYFHVRWLNMYLLSGDFISWWLWLNRCADGEKVDNSRYLAVFLVSMALQAIGILPIYLLGVTYLDDASPPGPSSLHIGIFTYMYLCLCIITQGHNQNCRLVLMVIPAQWCETNDSITQWVRYQSRTASIQS